MKESENFFPKCEWQNEILFINSKKQRELSTELTFHYLVHLRQVLKFLC